MVSAIWAIFFSCSASATFIRSVACPSSQARLKSPALLSHQADLVLVRPGSEWTVTTDFILSKCKWSPLEGHTFDWKVEKTFVNGHLLYNNGEIDETYRGQELFFER